MLKSHNSVVHECPYIIPWPIDEQSLFISNGTVDRGEQMGLWSCCCNTKDHIRAIKQYIKIPSLRSYHTCHWSISSYICQAVRILIAQLIPAPDWCDRQIYVPCGCRSTWQTNALQCCWQFQQTNGLFQKCPPWWPGLKSSPPCFFYQRTVIEVCRSTPSAVQLLLQESYLYESLKSLCIVGTKAPVPSHGSDNQTSSTLFFSSKSRPSSPTLRCFPQLFTADHISLPLSQAFLQQCYAAGFCCGACITVRFPFLHLSWKTKADLWSCIDFLTTEIHLPSR